MKKRRVYTIRQKKNKKKIRLAVCICILLALIIAAGLAVSSTLDMSSIATCVDNVKKNAKELPKKFSIASNTPVQETNVELADGEENTAESMNLTLDVMSQELEKTIDDPSKGSHISSCKVLPVYSDETLLTKIGSILPEQIYEVIDLIDIVDKPFFQIETSFGKGYVDAGYCLINLEDYLDKNRQINLVNAVSSPIKVFGFPINGITGEEIVDLESEALGEGNRIQLLYPTAKKLQKAMDLASDKGYILGIYETIRTDSVVKQLYQTMSSQIDKPIANKTYTGIDISNYFEEHSEDMQRAGMTVSMDRLSDSELQAKWARSWYNSALENQGSSAAETLKSKFDTGNYEIIVKNLPDGGHIDGKGYIHTADGKEVLDAKGYWTWADFDMVELPKYKDAEGNVVKSNSYNITFADLMLKDGEVSLENYFENGASDYSRGNAVDVTLLNTETDKEVPMQSDIFDMSLMSNPSLNNEEAGVLADIMKEAGFEADSYVWWHFTDQEIKKEYSGIPVIE